MGNKVKTAPKDVIDVLDSIHTRSPRTLLTVAYGGLRHKYGVIRRWLEEDRDIQSERELAIIEHVFGDERLEVEDD
ncbi:hypothetical protein [Weissella tructae]